MQKATTPKNKLKHEVKNINAKQSREQCSKNHPSNTLDAKAELKNASNKPRQQETKPPQQPKQKQSQLHVLLVQIMSVIPSQHSL